ncbi:CoA ester lyase [Paraburkholderia sp. Ac-20342]|uniref:HpcH/HpaI aldolase/citrate lyase family protein n=1 Tax=Paraburkholderia sp. Ac-20342 TaxID=2703889 RepID=UPI001F11FA4C|nr:CoA ester lyase [Paraburkholderia sp. Ac-20342]
MLETATTFLFVPGDREDRFEKALRSDADVVIIDWEASVITSRKEAARQNTISFLKQADGRKIAVRLNPYSGRDFLDDAAALWAIHRSIAGAFLTMVSSPDQVNCSVKALPPSLPLVGMIETAQALIQVDDIAACRPLCRIAFGNMDFQTDLELPPEENVGLIYPSSRLIIASRAAGLPGPIAGATENIADLDHFVASARFERNLGFLAKLCVHPSQLAPARQAFAPSEQEIAWAKQVLEATCDSHAVMIDGRMIDRPVIDRAQKILARAQTRTK